MNVHRTQCAALTFLTTIKQCTLVPKSFIKSSFYPHAFRCVLYRYVLSYILKKQLYNNIMYISSNFEFLLTFLLIVLRNVDVNSKKCFRNLYRFTNFLSRKSCIQSVFYNKIFEYCE